MTQRPVNLSLTKFSFPLAAIASILHRITGMVLFAGIGLGLYLLDAALGSERGFDRSVALLEIPLIKLVLWGVLATLIYHLLAGARHLLLDFHVGDTLEGGRVGSLITIAASIVLSLAAGWWLW